MIYSTLSSLTQHVVFLQLLPSFTLLLCLTRAALLCLQMPGKYASELPRLPCHCLLLPVTALTPAGALACSWLGKMKHVKQLLVDGAPNKRPQLDALANAYIYLQVLGPH